MFASFQSINRKDVDLALSAAGPGLALPAVSALRELLDHSKDETMANWQAVGDTIVLERDRFRPGRPEA